MYFQLGLLSPLESLCHLGTSDLCSISKVLKENHREAIQTSHIMRAGTKPVCKQHLAKVRSIPQSDHMLFICLEKQSVKDRTDNTSVRLKSWMWAVFY